MARCAPRAIISHTRASPRQEENRMELWQNAWNGNFEAVRRYIAMGVDVNWKNTTSVSERTRHTRERTVKASPLCSRAPFPRSLAIPR